MNKSSRLLGYQQQQRQEDDEDDLSRLRMDSTFSAVTQSSLGAIVRTTHGVHDPFSFSGLSLGESFSTSNTCHNRTFLSEWTGSNSSFKVKEGGGDNVFRQHHRRQSSIASTVAVGGALPPPEPPVSLFDEPRPYAHGNQMLNSQSSSTGLPDWARHRPTQSWMDSQTILTSRIARPGFGDRMFSPDQ